MSTATLEASHTLRCRLAATSVESDLGVIRGCTVAKAGVQATGKFVMLDASGNITRDEKLAKSRLPVFTDTKTLDTLMSAARAAGKRVKMREDHDDSVGARAGYVSDFKRISDDSGDRVVTDLHVFKSYRNRSVMLETATETPQEIGLSIDFTPTFELAGDKALMRVSELHAVDIVDEGAITPDGLLLSASVDTQAKSEISPIPSTPMADTPSPNADVLNAITVMGKSICDALSKFAAPVAPNAEPKADEALKAVNEMKTQLSAQATTIATMRREKALLGVPANERSALAAAAVEDIEKMTSGKKDYLTLVAEHAEKSKCKKSEAHYFVQKNSRDAYAAHLLALGVYDPARVTLKASA